MASGSLYDSDNLTVALAHCLVSPNEGDSNGEPANVVDGLFAVARAINRVADAIFESDKIDAGLESVAQAIQQNAKATRLIAHGGVNEPTGLEALSMTINGGRNGDWPSVAGAIREGFGSIASAIQDAQ